MQRILSFTFLISVCLFGGAITPSFALPRFALWKGEANCSGCHENPTGGELRTAGGEQFSINRLPMWKRGEKFTGQISPGIRLGIDLRSQLLYFKDRLVFHGTAADQSNKIVQQDIDTSVSVKGGHAMALPIYLSANLTQSVQAYAKFDMLNPTIGFEEWGMFHIVHSSGEILQSTDLVQDLYVKVGSFLPAFGIRFDDHTIYSRGGNATLSGFGPAGLFFAPDYKDIGGEIGALLYDHLFLTASVLNGNEATQTAKFVGPNAQFAMAFRGVLAGELVTDVLSGEIGGSLYLHPRILTGDLGDSSVGTQLFAVHGGVRLGPVEILGEADFGKYVYLPQSNILYPGKTRALALESTVNVTTGLTGLLRYETFSDQDGTAVMDEVKSRITVGLQWFPLRFVELRPEFRIAKYSTLLPGATVPETQTQTTLLFQTHLFF